jgi:hypothetical protein
MLRCLWVITLCSSIDSVSTVLVDTIHFGIVISASIQDRPTGLLFLCPGKDFRNGSSSVGWPDWPAYWSLNPSGVDRLSTKEATWLGFPPLRLTTTLRGRSWDTGVYAGLRQFHEAKGFDPEIQDIARHLGLPLCELSWEVDLPFAHGKLS